jgi:hypothetical protein
MNHSRQQHYSRRYDNIQRSLYYLIVLIGASAEIMACICQRKYDDIHNIIVFDRKRYDGIQKIIHYTSFYSLVPRNYGLRVWVQ